MELQQRSSTRSAADEQPIVEEQAQTSSDVESGEAPPASATGQPITWKNPRINIWRVFAALFSFIILGVNDAAYGVSGLQHSPYYILLPRNSVA